MRKTLVMILGGVSVAAVAGTSSTVSANAISLASGGRVAATSATLPCLDTRRQTVSYSNPSDLNAHKPGGFFVVR